MGSQRVRHNWANFTFTFIKRLFSSSSLSAIRVAAAAAKSLQSCPTLSDPMDCSLPGSSIHGIFQARVLGWGAIAFSVEWSRAKANRVLPRESTGHSKHPLPTTQEKALHMDITRWSTLKSDWLYSLLPKMEKLYTVSKNKTGSWLWLRSWTPYCKIQTYIESRENH